MTFEESSIDRVVRWRYKGFVARAGQAILVGALAWVATRSPLTLAWLAATLSVGGAEALLFRRLHQAGNSVTLRRAALASLAASCALFALIGPVLLVHMTPLTLAEAALLLASGALKSGERILVDGGQHLTPQARDVMFLIRDGAAL